ncbi:MAG: SM-20-related protein [Pseudohongiellaceae bacterium]|jgi:SM-20-related protein
MQTLVQKNTCPASAQDLDSALFARIAIDLRDKGFSINPAALPMSLSEPLRAHVLSMDEDKFSAAGVGRGNDFVKNNFIRTDEISWITGDSKAGSDWLRWASWLQKYLNEKLLLGLFSFESHVAHYGVDDYYKRHFDALRGEANRVLSLVLYLNSGWTAADGGELVLYENDQDLDGIKVTPLLGTLVVFLSEEFAHEVLPANRDRYCVAGWFRVNGSVSTKVDPPR